MSRKAMTFLQKMWIWLPTCRRISLAETGINERVIEIKTATIYERWIKIFDSTLYRLKKNYYNTQL